MDASVKPTMNSHATNASPAPRSIIAIPSEVSSCMNKPCMNTPIITENGAMYLSGAPAFHW